MRVKVPTSIVAFPHGRNFLIYNFLTKQAVTCSPNDLTWLTVATDWTSVEDIDTSGLSLSSEELQVAVDQLLELGVLIEEGTSQAELELEYAKAWELGPAAGLFHFSVTNAKFVDLAESQRLIAEKSKTTPSPELFWNCRENAILLDPLAARKQDSIVSIMKGEKVQSLWTVPAFDHSAVERMSLCRSGNYGICEIRNGIPATEDGAVWWRTQSLRGICLGSKC